MRADGRLLVVTSPSDVPILDSHLATVRTYAGNAAIFAATGTVLARATPSDAIDVVQTTNWRTRAVAQGSAGAQLQLSLSPDRRLLVAVSSDGVMRVWNAAADGALLATRTLIESGVIAQRGTPPVVALTDSGKAIVGFYPADAVRTYDVCDQCLNPRALLRQANARLAEIKPVGAS